MTPSPKCEALVKQFEGCRLHAYPDPKTGNDPWTIGIGATGPGITRGTVWTQAQADERFAADLARFAPKVADLLNGSPTTQHQFDALVSFAFNLGPTRLATSTLLRKHKAHDYEGAAREFGLWISRGTPAENGLRRRRAAEAELYGS